MPWPWPRQRWRVLLAPTASCALLGRRRIWRHGAHQLPAPQWGWNHTLQDWSYRYFNQSSCLVTRAESSKLSAATNLMPFPLSFWPMYLLLWGAHVCHDLTSLLLACAVQAAARRRAALLLAAPQRVGGWARAARRLPRGEGREVGRHQVDSRQVLHVLTPLPQHASCRGWHTGAV